MEPVFVVPLLGPVARMMPPDCRACSVRLDWQDGKGRQAYSLVMMTAYTITPINAPVGAVA